MIEEQRQGLLKRQGLTEGELAEIEQLAHICNTCDGLDLKLNWGILRARPSDEVNDFLFYQQGRLVGYLPIFVFTSHEAELSGMVHPDYRRQGIFSMLFHEAKEESRRRGLQRLFLIVEHTSRSGQAFAASLSPQYHHSEYKMVLGEWQRPQIFSPALEFRQAHPGEGRILAQITAAAFKIDVHKIDWYTRNVMEEPSRRFYVALLDGDYVGKIDVLLDEYEAFIYGFSVLPEHQHKGYGRQILARTIQAIQEMGQTCIAFEVAVENEHALSLYQSCGFYETGSYDYYCLAI
jgi:ribosomal protein S18 acetylase RimI-like enzyme